MRKKSSSTSFRRSLPALGVGLFTLFAVMALCRCLFGDEKGFFAWMMPFVWVGFASLAYRESKSLPKDEGDDA
jgi:hypothetical protein